MSDRRFIKPKGDMVIPMEGGAPLPTYGRGVAWSSYWQRRLNAGEIEPTDEKSVAAGEKRTSEAAAKAAAAEQGAEA